MRAAAALCVLFLAAPAFPRWPAASLHAALIGRSRPAESLTRARVLAEVPRAGQPAWLLYLQRSEHQEQLDRAELARERAALTGPVPPMPREGFSTRSMPLTRELAYYGSPEARVVADTILSFQIPNGGWSKNLDMTQPARLPGQSYTPNNLSRFLGQDDFDAPRDPDWNYVGTLDNDATNTELHFLARVSAAAPGREGDRYRVAFVRGVEYLLRAQFPNGGWPQVWPLEGGYHDAVTFNDNAVTESASLLTDVAGGQGDYDFVPPALRRRSAAAAAQALNCILRAQVLVAAQRTVWAQQEDALTLEPVSGRNFEPAALSAGESSDILLYLMQLPHPSAELQAAVHAGVAWLRANQVHGLRFVGGRGTPPSPGNPAGGRHLEPAPDAPALWPRYISLTTGKPIFGDRDQTIHNDVMDLSLERRNGYSWYSSGPQAALDAFVAWNAAHPLPNGELLKVVGPQ